MSPSRGVCEFCGEPVEALHTAAYPVQGWESERGAGGTNALIGRERILGRIAHAACARQAANRRRRGIADEQGSLL